MDDQSVKYIQEKTGENVESIYSFNLEDYTYGEKYGVQNYPHLLIRKWGMHTRIMSGNNSNIIQKRESIKNWK